MAGVVRTLVPDSLRSVSRTDVVEKPDSFKLSSDLHVHAMACACMATCTRF